MTELTLFDLILKNVRVNKTTKRKDRINMNLIDTTGPVRSRLYGFHLQGYTQSIQLGKLKALKLKPTKCRHTEHISIYIYGEQLFIALSGYFFLQITNIT